MRKVDNHCKYYKTQINNIIFVLITLILFACLHTWQTLSLYHCSDITGHFHVMT